MKITLETPGDSYTIHSYTESSVTLAAAGRGAQETLYRSFALSPKRLMHAWPPAVMAELEREHITRLLSLKPELVLIGTGARFELIPHRLLAPLMQRGIGVEAMDSGAACRTYNILAAEGR